MPAIWNRVIVNAYHSNLTVTQQQQKTIEPILINDVLIKIPESKPMPHSIYDILQVFVLLPTTGLMD